MRHSGVDILVVDDDPWIIELVIMAAEERGWSVLGAPNGPVGLELLAARRPRLLVLDVRLPQQSGWDILAQIEREQPHHPPVIMMTANQIEDEDGELHGASAILRKPFSVRSFLDLLAGYLD